MIAAVAISNELPLYTCNPGDFRGVDGLTVIAVPSPKAGGQAQVTYVAVLIGALMLATGAKMLR